MLREYATAIETTTTSADTIYALLRRRAERDGEAVVAQIRDTSSKGWQSFTAQEMHHTVRAVAKGLLSLGITKGSTVVIYAPTSYDWGVLDFACSAIGAVSVPVYDTDSAAQAHAIIKEVEPVIAFASGQERTQILEAAKLQVSSLQYVFNFESRGLKAVIDYGESLDEAVLQEAISQVHADDVSTVVYTSGSTGKPKGVMLSSRNFTHIVYAGYDVLPNMLHAPTRLLLFLPLAHCFARYIQYVAIGANGVVGYIPNAAHLLSDLRSFKPTYLLGVPRVFEKVYNAASQKAGAGIQGSIFQHATAHFTQWSKDEQSGAGHSLVQRIAHSFYERTVGTSIRSALGPNLAFLACGGAPMNADLAHFFNGFDGITFIQGYGMTETAAPCIVNFEAANRVGSVGKPGPGIAVRVTDDDELEVFGPNIFLGYRKDPERTAQAMDGKWLRTGDLATIDDDGFVFITGRKKDIIITAGGKNVSPAPLEDIIATCPIVSHVVVVGDGKPFIGAVITLDEQMLRTWLATQGLDTAMSLAQATQSDAVHAFIQQYVDQANATVSRAESIRKFIILERDFDQDDGTLTPSMKVVRPQVLRLYQQDIDTVLYAPKPGTQPPTSSSRQFLERATESITPLVDKAQENALPKLKEARERIEPVWDQARANMSDSIATVSRRFKQESQDTKDTVDSQVPAEPLSEEVTESERTQE